MARASGYKRSGWQWEKDKRAVLQRDERRCYLCGGDATTVDHVIPVAAGSDPHDRSNMRACCKPCHDAKTEQDRRNGMKHRQHTPRPKHATPNVEAHPNQARTR